MYQIKKGDLFVNAINENDILVHAVNNQGVWGSGIAVEFKKRYPVEFEIYKFSCNDFMVGESLGIGNIMCLFTSEHYGNKKDHKIEILHNTYNAIQNLFDALSYSELKKFHFHSPKINSGRFEVPWEQTEEIIKYLVDKYDANWTVWEIQ